MNKNHFCVFDLETGGGEDAAKCQVTQLSAIIINPRSLRVEAGGIFDSEICPIFDDDKAIEAGLNPVQQEALDVTRKTKEQLLKAPPEKIVWEKFKQFIKRFNMKNSVYTAPVPVGYNIVNYDMPIINRLCLKYGPTAKDKQSIFNQVYKIDLLDYFMMMTENSTDVTSRKLVDMMSFMGMPAHLKENAHNGLHDVKCTANIFIKLMHYQRAITLKTDYTKAFADNPLFIE
jgi:DNA polymerase III epsilon subunit-like protein